MDRDNPKLVFIPLSEATQCPTGLVTCYRDFWWATDKERGLILFKRNKKDSGAPQCNREEHICRMLTTQLYPWAECKFITEVFIKEEAR